MEHFERAREEIAALPGGEDVFRRFEEHLRANGVDLEKSGVVLGPMLEFDGAVEWFRGAWAGRRANPLLHRRDRPPFVIPERV